MKRPQYVFRPNLNDPQHRRAWALLQQVPPAKRKEFLVQSILAAEQTDRLEKSIRKVVREELQAVNITGAVPSPLSENLLIRELNGSECTYFALDTSGDIQTFDLLYDVDGDSEIFYPITSVDEDHYLVCAGFAVQNEVSALDDGSSTVLPAPDFLYAIINKDDYWHSITNYQSFE